MADQPMHLRVPGFASEDEGEQWAELGRRFKAWQMMRATPEKDVCSIAAAGNVTVNAARQAIFGARLETIRART